GPQAHELPPRPGAAPTGAGPARARREYPSRGNRRPGPPHPRRLASRGPGGGGGNPRGLSALRAAVTRRVRLRQALVRAHPSGMGERPHRVLPRQRSPLRGRGHRRREPPAAECRVALLPHRGRGRGMPPRRGARLRCRRARGPRARGGGIRRASGPADDLEGRRFLTGTFTTCDSRRRPPPPVTAGTGTAHSSIIVATMNFAERMSRLGTESAFEVLARAKALERQGREIVHLEIGEPDFDTPAHIRDAAK